MPRSFARLAPAIASLTIAFIVSSSSSPALAADDPLDAAILKKAKAATVRLKVTLADDTVVQGSGFVAAGPNLIFTNAHVLGMLRDESRKPKKVEVIVNGGTAAEKSYTGRVLGVDAGSDLGIVYVGAKDLPEPLALAPRNTELLETQNVYIFGYPFGDELNKNVTVTKSAVTGQRKTTTGYMQTQLGGGLHPGNSGGPIIDSKGAVVGVAVSGIKGTQIHYSVPVNYVHSFIGGRTHRWTYGVPYKDGTAIKMPLTTMSYDPLGQLRTIRAEVWTGDPGPERPATKSREPLPGDSERVKFDLDYKAGVALGEITLPEAPKGKVFWIQLFNVKENKTESWGSAKVFRPAPPVDRTPVVLAYKPQAWDAGSLQLTSEAELKLRDRDGADHSLVIKYQTDVLRVAEGKAKPDGSTTAKLTFSNAKQTILFDGKEEEKSARIQGLLAQIEKVPASLSINKQGELTDIRPGVASVVAKDRNLMAYLVLQMAQGLDATMVPLSGKEIKNEIPWSAKRDVMISVALSPELAVADLNYRYLGVRKLNDRMEAVIKADGTVRGRKGEGLNIAGKMEVQSSVDVESGQVVSATARIDVDLDLSEDGKSTGLASGVYSVTLRRAPKMPTKP